MTISPLGELSASAEEEGSLCSAPFPVPLLNQALPFVLFDLDETDALEAERAIGSFLALDVETRAMAATEVYNNYLEFREACCYEDVGCTPQSEARIWEHVHPTSVEVFRRGHDRKVYVQVMAECDWEREHGLQLLFSDGALVAVGDQGSGLAWRD